jgi:hypothetical protein
MKNWSSIVILILLIGFFCFGYRIHAKFNPCPEISSDTIYKVDTIERTIIDRIPYYIQRTDSIVYRDTVFKDVDTIVILNDYFAVHYFTRIWEDSLLKVTLEDAISENQVIDNKFRYQILRPQTVIQNIINEATRARSLYAGFSMPVAEPKYLELDAIVTYPRLYFGAGYSPGMKSITLKAGLKIFDF